VLFSEGAAIFDAVVVDGAIDGLATISKYAGSKLRNLQTGRLQGYQRLVLPRSSCSCSISCSTSW